MLKHLNLLNFILIPIAKDQLYYWQQPGYGAFLLEQLRNKQSFQTLEVCNLYIYCNVNTLAKLQHLLHGRTTSASEVKINNFTTKLIEDEAHGSFTTKEWSLLKEELQSMYSM